MEKYDPILEKSFLKIQKFLMSREDSEVKEAMDWFLEAMKYNVLLGKSMRAKFLMNSLSYLVPKDEKRDELIELSSIVGCCMEILHGYSLLADDIMDHSLTRRGKKCWHLLENVGMIAINDGAFLHLSAYEILSNFLGDHQHYTSILGQFFSTTYKTCIGQCIDLITTPHKRKTDFSLLNEPRYITIVKYKCSFFAFLLPVRVALFLAGITDKETHDECSEIMFQIGKIYQIQDDFLDCYGDPKVTGKIGTDIEDGKCTWLAVQCFKRLSSEELELFKKNFGISDKKCVEVIKSLYDKLNLKQLYFDFEIAEYEKIQKHISDLNKKSNIDGQLFRDILNIIYNRKK